MAHTTGLTGIFKHMALHTRQVDGLLVQLACAPGHGVALTSDGRVITWGNPSGGRLGRKRLAGVSQRQHKRPATVALVADQRVCAVSAGGTQTVVVTERGALWVWGQLGSGATYSLPVRARGEKLGGAHFLRACAGDNFALAVAVPPATEDEEDWD